MSRMGQELVNMAESINTMDIATTIIEALDTQGITPNRANVTKLWNVFVSFHLGGALERAIPLSNLQWEE